MADHRISPDTAGDVASMGDRLAEPKQPLNPRPLVDPSRLATVTVPPELTEVFLKAQQYVESYFRQRRDDPEHSTISIAGERYILVRAASMSVEFFDLVLSLYRDRGPREAWGVANNLLFDIAHALGKADARALHEKTGVTDPIERLSMGPVHFAFAGWAFVRIHPESRPTADENFFLTYDHPFSFEADAWLKRLRRSECPVCIMSAGYSSGWCEESFGMPLVSVEVQCQARGDAHCRFIMAPPSRIPEHLARLRFDSDSSIHAPGAHRISVPEFFVRKRLEDQIRASHEELEQRVWRRTVQLSEANRSLREAMTERQQMEQRLLQAQTMESIGRLAGGVAHDFNNLLTAIIGYTDLARAVAAGSDTIQQHLAGIREAADRATDLTRQLLALARQQPIEPRSVDLSRLVAENAAMLRLMVGDAIRLQITPAEDLWPVWADAGQLQRVLINLVVNARDACLPGGQITITTGNTTFDESYLREHPDASVGDHVMLSVEDTGAGIPPGVMARIFEPFFTTKDPGKGTGLGLSTCYGIARQHGGHIAVTSTPGAGTTFRVYLPRATEHQPWPKPQA